MRKRWLGLLAMIGWLAWCHGTHASSPQPKMNEVRIKCWARRASKPPDQNYACTVDVLGVVDHDRWLVFPFVMEEQLDPREVIASLQTERTEDGVVYCSAQESDKSFHVIRIPAHERLHIKEWRLWTMEHAEDITVWLGDELPLSNGETFGAVFKRLTTAYAASNWTQRGEWKAPKGTTVGLDPGGLQTIHLARLPQRTK